MKSHVQGQALWMVIIVGGMIHGLVLLMLSITQTHIQFLQISDVQVKKATIRQKVLNHKEHTLYQASALSYNDRIISFIPDTLSFNEKSGKYAVEIKACDASESHESCIIATNIVRQMNRAKKTQAFEKTLVSVQNAKSQLVAYDPRYPTLKKWMHTLSGEVKKLEKVQLPTGAWIFAVLETLENKNTHLIFLDADTGQLIRIFDGPKNRSKPFIHDFIALDMTQAGHVTDLCFVSPDAFECFAFNERYRLVQQAVWKSPMGYQFEAKPLVLRGSAWDEACVVQKIFNDHETVLIKWQYPLHPIGPSHPMKHEIMYKTTHEIVSMRGWGNYILVHHRVQGENRLLIFNAHLGALIEEKIMQPMSMVPHAKASYLNVEASELKPTHYTVCSTLTYQGKFCCEAELDAFQLGRRTWHTQIP